MPSGRPGSGRTKPKGAGAAAGGAAEEADGDAASTPWGRIRALYAAHNLAKLADIGAIMAKYDTRLISCFGRSP